MVSAFVSLGWAALFAALTPGPGGLLARGGHWVPVDSQVTEGGPFLPAVAVFSPLASQEAVSVDLACFFRLINEMGGMQQVI